MQRAWLFLLVVVGFLGVIPAVVLGSEPSSPSVELIGYLNGAKGQRFLLSEPSDHSASPWVGLGQSWHGCSLVSFDPKSETLLAKRNGATLRLRLRSSKTDSSVTALIRGDFTLIDGTKVYSPDAELKLAANILVTSPEGTMVSTSDQQIVAGDLTVHDGDRILEGKDAVLTVSDGHVRMRAKNLIVRMPAAHQ